MRQRFFSLIWALLMPFRAYLRHFPIQRGKGLILRCAITPLLPPGGTNYELSLPARTSILLQYRETLGLSSLLYGTFELAELTFVSRYLQSGDTAFDIGANVGIFSVVMGGATRDHGKVVAFEPVPSNVDRLKKNIELNRLGHVNIQSIALGNRDDMLEIKLADDAAYHSFVQVEKPFCSIRTVSVCVRKLDDVWHELGCPEVKLIKIDVEGAEDDVLSGGVEFLKMCRPAVLIEANDSSYLERLRKRFDALGYVFLKPNTFVAQNYFFYPPEVDCKVLAALQ